ncbi:hypothetical protein CAUPRSCDRAFT_11061 [Caulochytrium protostelioides]|uniref:RFX-type winged-helix domain-containing protein n=1 Tax=Caulochytrium protostelioides TaxID=1555241 RepID=A0A4V1ITJ3_9FUNG|nr:hypothetical protein CAUPRSCDRAFT_11061 [Caulochytrium protostelioides]
MSARVTTGCSLAPDAAAITLPAGAPVSAATRLKVLPALHPSSPVFDGRLAFPVVPFNVACGAPIRGPATPTYAAAAAAEMDLMSSASAPAALSATAMASPAPHSLPFDTLAMKADAAHAATVAAVAATLAPPLPFGHAADLQALQVAAAGMGPATPAASTASPAFGTVSAARVPPLSHAAAVGAAKTLSKASPAHTKVAKTASKVAKAARMIRSTATALIKASPPPADAAVARPRAGLTNATPESDMNQSSAEQWLTAHFTRNANGSIQREALYRMYFIGCKESAFVPLTQASFGKLMRTVFPALTSRRLGRRGNSKYFYVGLSVKPTSPFAAQLHVHGSTFWARKSSAQIKQEEATARLIVAPTIANDATAAPASPSLVPHAAGSPLPLRASLSPSSSTSSLASSVSPAAASGPLSDLPMVSLLPLAPAASSPAPAAPGAARGSSAGMGSIATVGLPAPETAETTSAWDHFARLMGTPPDLHHLLSFTAPGAPLASPALSAETAPPPPTPGVAAPAATGLAALGLADPSFSGRSLGLPAGTSNLLPSTSALALSLPSPAATPATTVGMDAFSRFEAGAVTMATTAGSAVGVSPTGASAPMGQGALSSLFPAALASPTEMTGGLPSPLTSAAMSVPDRVQHLLQHVENTSLISFAATWRQAYEVYLSWVTQYVVQSRVATATHPSEHGWILDAEIRFSSIMLRWCESAVTTIANVNAEIQASLLLVGPLVVLPPSNPLGALRQGINASFAVALQHLHTYVTVTQTFYETAMSPTWPSQFTRDWFRCAPLFVAQCTQDNLLATPAATQSPVYRTFARKLWALVDGRAPLSAWLTWALALHDSGLGQRLLSHYVKAAEQTDSFPFVQLVQKWIGMHHRLWELTQALTAVDATFWTGWSERTRHVFAPCLYQTLKRGGIMDAIHRMVAQRSAPRAPDASIARDRDPAHERDGRDGRRSPGGPASTEAKAQRALGAAKRRTRPPRSGILMRKRGLLAAPSVVVVDGDRGFACDDRGGDDGSGNDDADRVVRGHEHEHSHGHGHAYRAHAGGYVANARHRESAGLNGRLRYRRDPFCGGGQPGRGCVAAAGDPPDLAAIDRPVAFAGRSPHARVRDDSARREHGSDNLTRSAGRPRRQ